MITFTGHQVETSQALKDFTSEKLNRLIRHFDKIKKIHVVFGAEKLLKVVEATITIQGDSIHASSTSKDMYAAIDLLIDKLDRQLIKHKEKIDEHS